MPSRTPLILATALFIICASPVIFAAQAAHNAPPATDHMESSKQASDEHSAQGLSSTYLSCQKSAGDNLLRNGACVSAESKYQDTRLNRTYKTLLGALKPDAKKALVVAERAWLQSTSGDEAFETSLYGDSQVGNAQQQENRLLRLCARANALDKYLAFPSL